MKFCSEFTLMLRHESIKRRVDADAVHTLIGGTGNIPHPVPRENGFLETQVLVQSYIAKNITIEKLNNTTH